MFMILSLIVVQTVVLIIMHNDESAKIFAIAFLPFDIVPLIVMFLVLLSKIAEINEFFAKHIKMFRRMSLIIRDIQRL